MEKDQLISLHANFEGITQTEESGCEFWYARDLQNLLGYSQWRNFEPVIEKAIISSENAETDPLDHFARVRKMVDIGSGAKREIDDIALSRYACYLIAQNGDFANEITNFNVTKEDLKSEPTISREHVKNNREVRKLLVDQGIVPESLPPAEGIKKIQRRVASEQKKIAKNPDKLERRTDDDSGETS